MSGIIDTHFHIWNFDLRATYPKTDGSFDWPDESLPKVTFIFKHRSHLNDDLDI